MTLTLGLSLISILLAGYSLYLSKAAITQTTEHKRHDIALDRERRKTEILTLYQRAGHKTDRTAYALSRLIYETDNPELKQKINEAVEVLQQLAASSEEMYEEIRLISHDELNLEFFYRDAQGTMDIATDHPARVDEFRELIESDKKRSS